MEFLSNMIFFEVFIFLFYVLVSMCNHQVFCEAIKFSRKIVFKKWNQEDKDYIDTDSRFC